jgi:hypothetical protein
MDENSKQGPIEGFDETADRDVLIDDPDRIAQYRAVGLAEGFEVGTEDQVLWAWQWLSDHPEVTNDMEEWFALRVTELRSMGRIR